MKTLEFITTPELLDFVGNLLEEHGSDDKADFADAVSYNLEQILTRKKLLVPGVQQMFIEVLFAASAVHNLFYDGTVTSLFKLREIVNANKERFNMEVVEAVLQTVEAQLGDETPVPLCKPTTNSPTEIFALAVWIAKNYTPQA